MSCSRWEYRLWGQWLLLSLLLLLFSRLTHFEPLPFDHISASANLVQKKLTGFDVPDQLLPFAALVLLSCNGLLHCNTVYLDACRESIQNKLNNTSTEIVYMIYNNTVMSMAFHWLVSGSIPTATWISFLFSTAALLHGAEVLLLTATSLRVQLSFNASNRGFGGCLAFPVQNHRQDVS